jgi:hypothetical protein
MSAKSCIGGFYWLKTPQWHEVVVANCIDATPDGRPKRMRVQNGDHQGEVVMPGEYMILEREDSLSEIFRRARR